jgi:hypothetical protein
MQQNKIIRATLNTFSRAMAPVVKRSFLEPTPGQPEEVPEHNETESGSPQLSILNRVTEAAPVIGNIKVFLVLKIC